MKYRPGGETGIHEGLKIPWILNSVRVRVPPRAHFDCRLLKFENRNLYRGYRIAAIIPPCQGSDRGSTPLTRS